MPDSPLRLGVITLPNVSWPRMVLQWQWQRLEELGYDSVWDCDHFVHPYAPTESWFEGRHYQVVSARLAPEPIQRPRPPLTLAAEGPVSLGIVTDHADRWVTYGLHARSGITDPQALTDHIRRQNGVLDERCA